MWESVSLATNVTDDNAANSMHSIVLDARSGLVRLAFVHDTPTINFVLVQ